MKKRLLLLSVLSLFLATTSWAYDFEADGIYYNILSSSDKTCEVTYLYYYSNSNSSAYVGYVDIPETVEYNGDKYTVTSIGKYAFYNCRSLIEATIPNSVKSIGNHAFSYCSGLKNVDISNSVTSVEDNAFERCSGLKEVIIPNSVTSFGSSVFYYCSGLEEVTIGSSITNIGDYTFYECTSLRETTILGSVTNIGRRAFYDCKNLSNMVIPDLVTSIGEYAFYNCSSLTEITIPSSVTSIEQSTFYNCTSLTQVTIPESVTMIGGAAFGTCKGLTYITIPNSVTSIGASAFSSCSSLKEITIPNAVTSIEQFTFSGCSSLTEVRIPDSVTSIGNFAFNNCKGLTQLSIGNNVTTIGDDAFYGCAGLTEVTIPNSVKTIGSEAFRSCSSLEKLTIGNSVTSIGGSAFYSCPSLIEVTIPNSVRSIGSETFAQCTKLTQLTIGNSVTSIGGSSFQSCVALESITSLNPEPPTCGSSVFSNVPTETCTLYVPMGAEDAYITADQWQDFLSIVGIIIAPTVQTCEALEITYTSALLMANVTFGTEEISTQGFEYWTSDSDVQTIEAEGEEMSVTLTGLNQGTTYSYRAFVITESGTTYGETLTFTIPISPNVQTDGATDITYNSAFLTGAVTIGTESIIEQGFEYWTSDAEVQIAVANEDMSVTITDLEEGAEYSYRAFATTNSGKTYGETMTFTTLNLSLLNSLLDEIDEVEAMLNDAWETITEDCQDVAELFQDDYTTLSGELSELHLSMEDAYALGELTDATADEARATLEEIRQKIAAMLVSAQDAHEANGIEEIKMAIKEGAKIYCISGIQLSTLQKGMNIIRYSDGSTIKVLVK